MIFALVDKQITFTDTDKTNRKLKKTFINIKNFSIPFYQNTNRNFITTILSLRHSKWRVQYGRDIA